MGDHSRSHSTIMNKLLLFGLFSAALVALTCGAPQGNEEQGLSELAESRAIRDADPKNKKDKKLKRKNDRKASKGKKKTKKDRKDKKKSKKSKKNKKDLKKKSSRKAKK